MSEDISTIEEQITSQVNQWIESCFSDKSGLKKRKLEALAKFSELGFPHRKSEAYKYTQISRILQKSFEFSDVAAGPTSWTKSECQAKFYKIEKANHLVFLNGMFNEEYSQINSSSKDLEVRPLDSQTYDEYSAVKEYLGNIGDSSQDAFEALNLSYFNQGLYLQANKNSNNLPTFFYYFIDSENEQSIFYPRILTVAEQGATLDVYEKTFQKGSMNSLSVNIFEAEIKTNGNVNYTKIQNNSSGYYSVEGIYAHQHRDSRFYTNTYSFKGAVIRNNVYISVDDENCEAHMNGLYILSGKTHVDNNTSVDHRKPNSFSNELYKGILGENSRAVFNGKIYVRPDAQKTNAFQANNNILLSETATINTKPQLEIWADDVKCSHGCTTGQLDEEAIFYLRSRGIEKSKAQSLMLNAFAADTLQEVKQELVKKEIEDTILGKLD